MPVGTYLVQSSGFRKIIYSVQHDYVYDYTLITPLPCPFHAVRTAVKHMWAVSCFLHSIHP